MRSTWIFAIVTTGLLACHGGDKGAASAPVSPSNEVGAADVVAEDPCETRDARQRRLDACMEAATSAEPGGDELRDYARRQSALARYRHEHPDVAPDGASAEDRCRHDAERLEAELAAVGCEPSPAD